MNTDENVTVSLFKNLGYSKSGFKSKIKEMQLDEIITAGSEVCSAPNKKNLIAFMLNIFSKIASSSKVYEWLPESFLLMTKLARLISESGYQKVWRLYRR